MEGTSKKTYILAQSLQQKMDENGKKLEPNAQNDVWN
jgi:hypothetical protein